MLLKHKEDKPSPKDGQIIETPRVRFQNAYVYSRSEYCATGTYMLCMH